MKERFLKLVSNIKLYSSYYFAVAAVLGSMWGAFTMYDNWRDNNRKLQGDVGSIIQTQIEQRSTDSLLLKHQIEMIAQLGEIQNKLNSLELSYVKYLSKDKSLTTEKFLEYMEGLTFDVKKKSLSGEVKPPLLYPKELIVQK